jgi:hypothetical protein
MAVQYNPKQIQNKSGSGMCYPLPLQCATRLPRGLLGAAKYTAVVWQHNKTESMQGSSIHLEICKDRRNISLQLNIFFSVFSFCESSI